MSAIKDFCQTLILSVRRFSAGHHNQRALALTYYTVFSIVPLLALFFGIAKGFAFENQFQEIVYAKFAHQREILNYLYTFAETTLKKSSGGLVAGIGVIALFWTVFWLIGNVENAFNLIWGLPERRDWWRKFTNYLSLMLLTPVLLVCVSTFGVVARQKIFAFTETLPFASSTALTSLELLAQATPMLIVCIIFTLLYRYVPATKVRFTSALLAGIIAGVAYQLLQDGFIFLQGCVFRYNRIYGSFAAIPLFLVWLNWSWQIILFGAEISFVSQNLNSGIFEAHRIREMNLRVRREHQLAITQIVFQHFDRENGALPVRDLQLELHLPEFFLLDEVQELIDKGVLCRAQETNKGPCVLPGVPTEKLTLIGFISKLNGSGDPEEFPTADRCFTQMESDLAKASGSRLVRSIER